MNTIRDVKKCGHGYKHVIFSVFGPSLGKTKWGGERNRGNRGVCGEKKEVPLSRAPSHKVARKQPRSGYRIRTAIIPHRDRQLSYSISPPFPRSLSFLARLPQLLYALNCAPFFQADGGEGRGGEGIYARQAVLGDTLLARICRLGSVRCGRGRGG